MAVDRVLEGPKSDGSDDTSAMSRMSSTTSRSIEERHPKVRKKKKLRKEEEDLVFGWGSTRRRFGPCLSASPRASSCA